MTQTLETSARQSALLAQLFDQPVVAYELRGSADSRTLLPQEAGTCEAFRPGRLAEFAAGRLCARRALEDLDHANFAVVRNPDRSPRWPETVAGSITHTVGFCGAVAAPRTLVASIGIDAELAVRVAPDLWSHAFTVDELGRFPTEPPAARRRAAAVAFSAKEAFYKCQFGVTGKWLDYRDVSVEVVPDGERAGSFVIRAATSKARVLLGDLRPRGQFCIDGPLVVTGIALAPGQGRWLAARSAALGE